MKKILVIHTLGIGDLVMFTPALQVLMHYYPEAIFDFLIEQKSSYEIVSSCERLGKVFYLDNSRSLYEIVVLLRREKYDLAIYTSGMDSWKTGPFIRALGIDKTIGEHKRIPNCLFSNSVKRSLKNHRIQDNLNLIRPLIAGSLEDVPQPKVWVDRCDGAIAESFVRPPAVPGETVVGVHPGSSKQQAHKRWPLSHFETALKTLNQKRNGLYFLIFAGAGEEEDAFNLVQKVPNSRLVAGISLKTAAAILANCSIFISNDSALGHVAAAMNTPVLSIFGPTNPEKTAPHGSHVSVVLPKVDCAPCWPKVPSQCKSSFCQCLYSISPYLVVEKFLEFAHSLGL